MKETKSIITREAIKEDCQGIYDLIKELAIFVKAESRLEITPQQLLEDGFGMSPSFKAFVATDQNEIVGVAIFYDKYSTWKGKAIYLEDLVIKESYRGKNLGTILFNKVKTYAKENNANRMDWQIYAFNEPALSFYKKHNSFLEGGWINGYIQRKDF